MTKIKEILSSLSFSNVTTKRFGYVKTPSDMIVDGNAVTVLGSDHVHAVLGPQTRPNTTINAQVYILSIGNQTISYAREI